MYKEACQWNAETSEAVAKEKIVLQTPRGSKQNDKTRQRAWLQSRRQVKQSVSLKSWYEDEEANMVVYVAEEMVKDREDVVMVNCLENKGGSWICIVMK